MAAASIGEAGGAAAEEIDVGGLTFEAALAELEAIVQKLERGQLDLEASITAYERGTVLRRHCAEKLRQVQLRVERITVDGAGVVSTQPFDPA